MPTVATHNGLLTFPDWLVDLDPKLADSLASIGSSHGRLRMSVANGYDYQHVFQRSLNAVTDKMVADGIMSREDHASPVGPARKVTKPIALNSAFIAAQTSNNRRSYEILGTVSYTCRLAVTKLMDGVQQGFQSGDMLVPFLCLRGVLEHIAHFHALIHKLRPYSVPATFNEANSKLGEIYSLLVKASYGTRIDWKLLFAEDVDAHFESDQLKYYHEENRADRECKSILSAIDSLSKSVKGTRQVYEVLCEFAHPNVGNLFLFTESAGPCTDMHGVQRIKKRLSPNVPIGFLKEWAPAACRIFSQTDRCLQHLELLLTECNTERQKVLLIIQVVVRRLVNANSKVFDAYAPCPCGSELKVKFCCGQ